MTYALLLQTLSLRGPLAAKELCIELSISQPTLSRLVTSSVGDHMRGTDDLGRVIRIGSARNSRYAATRALVGVGTECPIYSISPRGDLVLECTLYPLRPTGYWVEAHSPRYLSRLYDDIPYFLDDIRPAGFLGRLLPKRYPDLQLPDDVRSWSAETTLRYWVSCGRDLPGNLILGSRVGELLGAVTVDEVIPRAECAARYEQLANDVFVYGPAGSSAAGEQPKFLTARAGAANERVDTLVKFASTETSRTSIRRVDLLRAEHLALTTLSSAGITAAPSELIEGSARLFLEVTRFDRTPSRGRRGIVTLLALDSEFVGSLGPWSNVAAALLKQRKITASIHQEILVRYFFGTMIGNTDMHGGNLAFFADGETITELAPVYDMLPMAFFPRADELPAVKLMPILPRPHEQDAYSTARRIATRYWDAVWQDTKISSDFKQVAQLSGVEKLIRG